MKGLWEFYALFVQFFCKSEEQYEEVLKKQFRVIRGQGVGERTNHTEGHKTAVLDDENIRRHDCVQSHTTVFSCQNWILHTDWSNLTLCKLCLNPADKKTILNVNIIFKKKKGLGCNSNISKMERHQIRLHMLLPD